MVASMTFLCSPPKQPMKIPGDADAIRSLIDRLPPDEKDNASSCFEGVLQSKLLKLREGVRAPAVSDRAEQSDAGKLAHEFPCSFQIRLRKAPKIAKKGTRASTRKVAAKPVEIKAPQKKDHWNGTPGKYYIMQAPGQGNIKPIVPATIKLKCAAKSIATIATIEREMLSKVGFFNMDHRLLSFNQVIAVSNLASCVTFSLWNVSGSGRRLHTELGQGRDEKESDLRAILTPPFLPPACQDRRQTS
jgi:hypothetical protein